MTAVQPGEDGKALWQDALNLFFCGDKELIHYVQQVAGMIAVGKVFVEALIIAYGDGRNGKSTFWNTLAHVLGTYSGNISADALTVGCKRNVRPELAEAKGKRMLIASELEEGTRLNTGRHSPEHLHRKAAVLYGRCVGGEKVQRSLCLYAQPHRRALYQPPTEGRCQGCRDLAAADRDSL